MGVGTWVIALAGLGVGICIEPDARVADRGAAKVGAAMVVNAILSVIVLAFKYARMVGS